MVEYSRCGRLYVAERRVGYTNNIKRIEKKAISSWGLGVLLMVIIIVCPIIGVLI